MVLVCPLVVRAGQFLLRIAEAPALPNIISGYIIFFLHFFFFLLVTTSEKATIDQRGFEYAPENPCN